MRKHFIDYEILSLDDFDPDYVRNYVEPFLNGLGKPRTRSEYLRHILYVSSYFCSRRKMYYSFLDIDETDAKEYFSYLASVCREGNLGNDTFRLRLFACRSFTHFLKEQFDVQGIRPEYEPPFDRILPTAAPQLVREHKILSDETLDYILNTAKDYDDRLYILYLLSFRMALKQKSLLALRRKDFEFFKNQSDSVGILHLMRNDKEVYLRIPSDIYSIIKSYVESKDDHLFLNMRGKPMSAQNLSTLVSGFTTVSKVYASFSQIRARGLIDLIASNQNDKDAVIDYVGLSKKMVEGYVDAITKVPGCVADNCKLQVLQRQEEDIH